MNEQLRVIALDAAQKLLPTSAADLVMGAEQIERWLRRAATAEPFDLATHLKRQRDWSFKTFGPGSRAKGVVDHIRKELNEIEQNPHDLEEWIDVVILGLDGAWREGYTPEEVIAALEAKQAKNEARQWPDWRTAPPDKAIEHVK